MQMSDRELVSRLQSLASAEHAATVEILLHLNEVERRRLHLTLGYGTMFDFVTRHLRYSASAAGRRIQVARCIARHPDLLEPLRAREISLTTIALIAGLVDDGNVQELLDAIRGKSQREVERIVATYRPAVEVRDQVRPVRVGAKAASSDQDGEAAPLFASAMVRSLGSVTSGCHDANRIPSRVSHSRRREWDARGLRPEGDGVVPPTAAASTETVTERRFKIQFAAGPDFVRKLEEARAILSGSSKGVSLEHVLETTLDAFLDRKSLFRRKARRERSGARRKPSAAAAARTVRGTNRAAAVGETPRSARADRTRHIPVAVRDAVFARDGGRCTYVGAHGVPCESRHNLHVDHVEPFARGGPPTFGNLRLLCAAHNQLEAERVYGSEWMRLFRGGGSDSS